MIRRKKRPKKPNEDAAEVSKGMNPMVNSDTTPAAIERKKKKEETKTRVLLESRFGQ